MKKKSFIDLDDSEFRFLNRSWRVLLELLVLKLFLFGFLDYLEHDSGDVEEFFFFEIVAVNFRQDTRLEGAENVPADFGHGAVVRLSDVSIEVVELCLVDEFVGEEIFAGRAFGKVKGFRDYFELVGFVRGI